MDLIEISVVLPWTTRSENPINIGVSMGSDKFEKLSEDGFIGGYSFDEENGLSQMCLRQDGTCECGMWQVSGVPCKHAVAAILHKGGQPEDYVHHYLTKESFMMTYMGTIKPIPDECAWPEVEAEPSLDVVVPVKVGPPDIKTLVGRPKKKRTKELGEAKLTGKQ
ncbi:hypothetical protein WN943_014821 [Citrus x changshan-huyou]